MIASAPSEAAYLMAFTAHNGLACQSPANATLSNIMNRQLGAAARVTPTHTDRGPVDYLTLANIAQRGRTTAAVVKVLHATERMPEPDVFVGSRPGWHTDRVVLWLAPLVPRETLRTMPVPDPLPVWWEVEEPEYLLCREEVASILGIQPASVNTYRLRDSGFVRPVARVGPDGYGWDHEQVLTWGEEQGYLTPEGARIPLQPGRRRSWTAAPRT